MFKKFLNLPKLITLSFVLLFIGNVSVLIFVENIFIEFGELFRVNSFTVLIWTVVTFFGALISRYASNYLTGFKFHNNVLG